MATFEETIVWDATSESNWRNGIKRIRAGLAALGLIRVNGQAILPDVGWVERNIDTLSFAFSSSQAATINATYDYNAGLNTGPQVFDTYKAFDGNTADNTDYNTNGGYDLLPATRWRSTAAPSYQSPQFIVYDAIQIVTVGGWKLFFGNSNADPKDATLQYSDDGATWEDAYLFEDEIGNGFVTYNLPTPISGRFFRLLINANNGNMDYVEVIEWELYDATPTKLAAPVSLLPGNNSWTYREQWRFNDALQSTAPVYIAFHWGRSVQGNTRIDFHVCFQEAPNQDAPRSAGPGNLLFGSGLNQMSGNSGRLMMRSEGQIFILERLKDANGANTDEGIIVLGAGSINDYSNSYVPQSFGRVLDKTGPDTTGVNYGWANLMPNNLESAVDGQKVHLYPIFPFNVRLMPPIISAATYFMDDITADTIFTAPYYGATHTFRALGVFNAAYETVPTKSLAVLWE